MGSFIGHFLNGTMFMLFALWWSLSINIRYCTSRKKRKPFVSTTSFLPVCLPKRFSTLPVESLLKLIFPFTMAIFGELIPDQRPDGSFSMGAIQHATMIFFFTLVSIAELGLHYRLPFPKDLDYATLILALMMECATFSFHLFERSSIDVLVHALLVFSTVLCIITVILEMRHRNNFLCALARAYTFLLQGTWLWQIGFVLFNPLPNATPWKDDDTEQLMLVTLMYSWHFAGNLIFMVLMVCLISFISKWREGKFKIDDTAYEGLLKNNSDVIMTPNGVGFDEAVEEESTVY